MVSPVMLSVLELPVSLAGTRSGAPTVAATVTAKVVVVLAPEESVAVMVTIEAPVRPADVAATIYAALGIDPHHHLHTADGRPVEILDEGRVIEALYA